MGDILKYYICEIPANNSFKDLSGFDSISAGAFKYAPAENILFTKTTTIEESTFENCKELKFVACGNVNNIAGKDICCIKSNNKIDLKTIDWICTTKNSDVDLKIFSIGDKFVIPKDAFKGCDKLETVILPKNKCIIGKDAFAHCKSLRTVVFLGDDIAFIDNPFVGCDNLTIVYKQSNSYLKAFIEVHSFNKIEIG